MNKVFIGYCSRGGEQISEHIYNYLSAAGMSVCYDRNYLRNGVVNDAIFDRISECDCYVAVLTPGALDRCGNPDDLMSNQIAAAIAFRKKIVTIIVPGFQFPNYLPHEIRDITKCQGLVINNNGYIESQLPQIYTMVKTKKSTKKKTIILATASLMVLLSAVFSVAAFPDIMKNPDIEIIETDEDEDSEDEDSEDEDSDDKNDNDNVDVIDSEDEDDGNKKIVLTEDEPIETDNTKSNSKTSVKKDESEKIIPMKDEDKKSFEAYKLCLGEKRKNISENLYIDSYTEEWMYLHWSESNLHENYGFDKIGEDAVCKAVVADVGNIFTSVYDKSDGVYISVDDLRTALGEGVISCEVPEKYSEKVDLPYYLHLKRDGYVFRIFYDEDRIVDLTSNHCMVSFK